MFEENKDSHCASCLNAQLKAVFDAYGSYSDLQVLYGKELRKLLKPPKMLKKKERCQ